jgi:hypothetical protein
MLPDPRTPKQEIPRNVIPDATSADPRVEISTHPAISGLLVGHRTTGAQATERVVRRDQRCRPGYDAQRA